MEEVISTRSLIVLATAFMVLAAAALVSAQTKKACCLQNGTCVDELGNMPGYGIYITTEQQCMTLSDNQGTWFPTGTDCAGITCLPVGGACCLPDGSCVMVNTADECESYLGGPGSFYIAQDCADIPCCIDCVTGTKKIITLMAGKKDDFNNADGLEPSYVIPGSGFEFWLINVAEHNEWLLFDTTDLAQFNQAFGHTFAFPYNTAEWNNECRCVTRAWLTAKVVPRGDYTINDGIRIRENGFDVWHDTFQNIRFLNTTNSNPWATGNSPHEFTLPLHAMPQSSTGPWPSNIIGTLFDNDIEIGGDADTEWDYIEIIIEICDTCTYYKAGWEDYCPEGMPDFSQLQDFDQDGNIEDGYDGPAALANCLWWFDSKYEPTPVDPRPFGVTTPNDGYPIIYDIVSAGIDDHDSNNVRPLVAELASPTYMSTNGPFPGTNIVSLDNGVRAWLAARGLQDKYVVNMYGCEDIDWPFLVNEVERSQDVILLLGFYLQPDSNPSMCCRIGGHYVTVAGVSLNGTIAISDPFFDKDNPGASSHNDASNVSHDIYQMLSPGICNTITPCDMMLFGYPPAGMDVWRFLSQNGGTNCANPGEPGLVITVIEYAEIICPKIDTCTYYKPGYGDYSPSGMPDFDQKQGIWVGATGGWSFDGPVALANCLWWFDSKFETNTQPPPVIIDNYPLLASYSSIYDDHDPVSVMPFVSDLAIAINCNVMTNGTDIFNLWNGSLNYLQNQGLSSSYTVDTFMVPTFERIRTEVLRSQDVIMLLGFYEKLPNGDCNRLGGHYVTVAGTCENDLRLCISDPWFDMNEGEPYNGSAHSAVVHNDAKNISGLHGTINHDAYNVALTDPPVCAYPWSPIDVYELTDYPDNWQYINNFYDLNYMVGPSGVFITPVQPYQNGEIHTLIDFALVICPTSKCGDVNGDEQLNVGDAVFLINFVFKGGPAPDPLCIGDANGDGGTNVGDAVYLISYVFKGGPAPVEGCCP